ncbi:MAG: fumarate hydratase C-terminal domain-containing protein, partial [Myxococcales bacterium]|nr:fumarate hydratase C-terminal domain-containing protein [Myxococcales bacterium]
LTDGDDAALLAKGIARTYATENLRFSLLLPKTTLEEVNSQTNLPALVELTACPGEDYRFLFVAKGGGSSNKTQLFQPPPSLLMPGRLDAFLIDKVRGLGTAACPPYRVAIVIGGLSPESCLTHAKLASCGALDGLPTCPSADADGALGFRDLDLEARLLEASRHFGIGAQLPGRFLVLDVRVVRLPRHSASLPIGLSVSCLADRQIWGSIDRDGVWLEQLEAHPERFSPREPIDSKPAIPLDLNQPMTAIREALGRHPVGTRFSLSGPLVVARDLAHARIRALIESGRRAEVPQAFFTHPVYYAGPAKTPPGRVCGAFGPTTAGRMDADLDFFQSHGAALVTLAKGNRGAAAREACQRHGGFYLGTIGGTATFIADRCIQRSKLLAFQELGMEALFQIEVEGLPAFTILDDKGGDLYATPAPDVPRHHLP